MISRKIFLAISLPLSLVATSQIDMRTLVAKAKSGDVKSQYALAVMCENNAQTSPDWNEAAWWYRHAAEQGDLDAQRRLAWCYENGKGVSQDFDKALVWYLQAAEYGDSVSQFQVGRIYRDISQDYEKSFSWFHRSSESGYPPAVNAVGECYRDGFGVAQNHSSAVIWFRKAADMDNPEANYNLGRAYQYGFGVEESVSSARSYYETALSLGHPAAATALDQMMFRIVGSIKGLVPGDTLRFERIPLDGVFNTGRPSGFKVIVSERDRFKYDGVQNHAQYYRMVYAPLSGNYGGLPSDGLDILVENGEYVLRGSVDDIYFSTISGGTYDDPLLVEVQKMTSDFSRREAMIIRDIGRERKKKDSKKTAVLESALAAFRRDNSGLCDSIRCSIEKFKILKPSSTFTLVDYLENLSEYSIEDLRAAYDLMDSVATDSYYGKMLMDNIMKAENVSVGRKMPFFALISSWHEPVSLNNLLGKYALIYYWDTGTSSREVDKEVVRLAEQYPGVLEVVGITPSEKYLENIRREDKYSSLLRHKWKDCEFVESNRASIDLMVLGKAPYFILLSPEGEILDRGGVSLISNLSSLLSQIK